MCQDLGNARYVPLAVSPAAVTNVATHGAPPFVIPERFHNVLPHAHLEAPAAPSPSSPASGGLFSPFAALAPCFHVAGFLAAEMTGGTLGATRAVHVFAPRFRPARVSIPFNASSVKPVVVLQRIILSVLALRLSQFPQLRADLAGVNSRHGSRRVVVSNVVVVVNRETQHRPFFVVDLGIGGVVGGVVRMRIYPVGIAGGRGRCGTTS